MWVSTACSQSATGAKEPLVKSIRIDQRLARIDIYPLPERPYAPVVDYEEGQNWLGHVYSSKSQRDVTTQEQPVLTMSLRRSISVASPLSRAPRSNIVLIKPFCTTLYNMTEFYPHKQSYLPAASLFRSVPVRSASHPCCELCDEPKFILLFHEQVTK